MKLGLFLLAGQFPGMTEGDALTGAVDNAVAAEQDPRRTRETVLRLGEEVAPRLADDAT